MSRLSKTLRVDESAVAQVIDDLIDVGFPIVSDATEVSLTKDAFLESDLIRAALLRIANVESVDAYFLTDSTNTRLSQINPGDGWSIAVAEYQTAGRGRRGRHWENRLGQSINLSLSRKIPITSLGPLSLVVGVAVVDALASVGVTRVGLKWPNDLIVDGSKLGGILVETQVSGTEHVHVVIGVGINFDLRDFDLSGISWSVTDLLQCAGRPDLSRTGVVSEVLQRVVSNVDDYLQMGFGPFLSRWSEHDNFAGKKVRVSLGEQVFHGTAQGVDEQGGLVLQLADGSVREFLAGEVSLRAAESG